MNRGGRWRRPLVLAALLEGLGVALGTGVPWLGLALLPLSALWARSLAVFFGLGLLLAVVRAPPSGDDQAWVRGAESPVVLEGVVLEAPELRPTSEVLTLELLGMIPEPPGPMRAARGRVRVVLPRAEEPTRGAPRSTCAWAGDQVRVLVRAHSSGPPLHEGEQRVQRVQARRGIVGFARAQAHEHCRRVGRAVMPGFAVGMERTRSALHSAIESRLPGSAGAVVRAFATGDRSGIPPALETAFAESGLSHLLAVSGLNLAIVAGLFVVGLAALLRRSTWVSLGPGAARAAALGALPLVVVYTFLVGLSASAVRAAFMMGALLVVTLLRRRPDPLSILALAVVLMLSIDPLSLYDVSFQLSFAAVVALFLLFTPLRDRLAPELHRRPWWWRHPIEISLASFAATLGTAPLVAFYFQRISLVGLLVNVPAAPLGSFVLVPLSLLGGAVAPWFEAAAAPLLTLAHGSAEVLIALAEGAQALPWASIRLSTPSIVEVGLAYLGIYAIALPAPWRRRAFFSAIMALFIIGAEQRLERVWRAEVEFTFLPVGQGDATVVELPGGVVWLIDVGPPGRDGPGAAERVIAPHLRRLGIRAIDKVVLTHPHADHIGGLSALAREFPIREVLWNGDTREASAALIDAIRVLPNQVVDADAPPWRFGAAEVRLLGPAPNEAVAPIVNDGSLVLSIAIGRRRILITGDAEVAAEAALVERQGAWLASDVLKAGHHGSRTSSSDRFLDAVKPSHVVLSLGRGNGFGFPHKEVMERLRARDIECLRTDVHGLIRLVTDGERLEWSSFSSSRVPSLESVSSGGRGLRQSRDEPHRPDEIEQHVAPEHEEEGAVVEAATAQVRSDHQLEHPKREEDGDQRVAVKRAADPLDSGVARRAGGALR